MNTIRINAVREAEFCVGIGAYLLILGLYHIAVCNIYILYVDFLCPCFGRVVVSFRIIIDIRCVIRISVRMRICILIEPLVDGVVRSVDGHGLLKRIFCRISRLYFYNIRSDASVRLGAVEQDVPVIRLHRVCRLFFVMDLIGSRRIGYLMRDRRITDCPVVRGFPVLRHGESFRRYERMRLAVDEK